MTGRERLTPRLAEANAWVVLARCERCDISRSALGAWRKAAADRDLIVALERRRLVCMKCRQACETLLVGKHWPEGGYQRIMTVRMGALVERHDDPPVYHEKPPGVGAST